MITALRAHLSKNLLRMNGFRQILRAPAWALTILLALTPALLPTPASAGCNLGDIVSAIQKSGEATAVCQPVCENNYQCYAAAAMGAALTQIANREENGHAKVANFCKQITGGGAQALDYMQKASELSEDLANLLQEYQQDATVVLAIMKCGCKTEELNIVTQSSFGVCAEDVLKSVGCGKINWSTGVVESCTPFGSWIDAASDWMWDQGTSLLRPAGGGDNTCYTSGPDAMVVQAAGPPPGGKCAFGMQCNPCGWSLCNKTDPNAIGLSPGVCGCAAPYTAKYGPTGAGGKLQSCSCESPNQSVGSGAGAACLCPIGQVLKNGACTACGSGETYVPAVMGTNQNGTFVAQPPTCSPCPLGTKANADKSACVNACNNAAGEILSNEGSTSGQCVTCASNQIALHQLGSLGVCQACAPGQTASSNHGACVRACPPGQISHFGFLNPTTGTKSVDTCQPCAENSAPHYDGADTSKGSCQKCPDGTFAHAGATQCTALNCGVAGYQDPANPHACKTCPATQIYIPATKEIFEKPGEAPGSPASAVVTPGHCGCGENQRLEGDICVCAAGAIATNMPTIGGAIKACSCPEGAHLDAASFSCQCPKGAVLDKNGTTCLCPPGKSLQGKACVIPSLQNQTPAVPPLGLRPPLPARVQAVPASPSVTRDCSRLGRAFITNPRNIRQCLRCPRGQIANENRSACIGRPAAAPRDPDINARPFRPRFEERLRACPPGMRPNLRGTGCILMPRLMRPGPLRRLPGRFPGYRGGPFLR